VRYENDEYFNYDLREPKRKIIHPDKLLQHTNKVVANTNDWSNIPYYPTSKEKREQTAEYLIKTGKQVPISLLKQIQKDKEDTIKSDVYNNMVSDDMNDYGVNNRISNIPINNRQYINTRNINGGYPHPSHPSQPSQTSQLPQPPNKYSPQYANYIGASPRATASASARIKLGGVF
jgi:uncharacterized protein (UPF0210 family)